MPFRRGETANSVGALIAENAQPIWSPRRHVSEATMPRRGVLEHPEGAVICMMHIQEMSFGSGGGTDFSNRSALESRLQIRGQLRGDAPTTCLLVAPTAVIAVVLGIIAKRGVTAICRKPGIGK